MGLAETIAEIRAGGIVAGLRLSSAAELLPTVEALRAGGVAAVQVPLDSPEILAALERVRLTLGRPVLLGAGRVLTASDARQAIRSGAEFLFTSVPIPEVTAAGNEAGVPVVAGALTPAEILRAFELGSAMVALFPAGPLGPRYLAEASGALPHIPLLPAGGITLENAGPFLHAGAAALLVDEALASSDLVHRRAFDEIAGRAAEFAEAVRQARGVSARAVQPIKPIEGPDNR